MTTYYIKEHQIENNIITVDDSQDIHHMKDVMRLKLL